MRINKILNKLIRNQKGVAMTEFAISLPFFIGVGMYGIELSNMSIVNMAVSQTALNLSDNASRLGQTDGSIITPTITEHDVLSTFAGANIQGRALNLFENGRLILTSLELDSNNNQLVRWQRCKGLRNINSRYGTEGTNGTDTPAFVGMGPVGREVLATNGTAVMFVEIEYEYTPLFGTLFVQNRVFRQEAAFNIRDSRNLAAGLAPSPSGVSSGPPATCDQFTAT